MNKDNEFLDDFLDDIPDELLSLDLRTGPRKPPKLPKQKKHEEPEMEYTVCIGHAMHPEESISEKNFRKVETFISKECIDVMHTPGPMFKPMIKLKRMFLRDGKMMVICCYEETQKWIEGIDLKKFKEFDIKFIKEN